MGSEAGGATRGKGYPPKVAQGLTFIRFSICSEISYYIYMLSMVFITFYTNYIHLSVSTGSKVSMSYKNSIITIEAAIVDWLCIFANPYSSTILYIYYYL
jgi:hypothetical protein